MSLLSRIFRIIFISVLIITLTLAGILGIIVKAPQPQVAGAINVQGLQNSVTIFRDEWGIPQIYAESTHDLLFAQGYVHAQDRFWQMEFWRRLGSGRLSELFGETTLSTDRFVRTAGWARSAARDESLLDPETRQALQWYADGVNAYLDTHGDLGLEFTLLGLQGVSARPEPWTVVNSLTWLKVMAWDLSGNMQSELLRAMLIQQVGLDAALELLPFYPSDHPVILPNPAFGFDASDTLAAVRELNALTGGGFDGIGSNNWVIAGSRTDTHKPYLANDPHLGIQMPSIWYEIGLHCRKVADYCPFDVVGFSFPGVPAVILGHNQRIAWGATNLGPDVQDLYIEKINPDNPNQYEVNGAWVDAQVIPEIILVQGKVEPDPEHPEIVSTYDQATNTTTVTLNVRITRHGPIISDVSASAGKLKGNFNGFDMPTPSGIALHWTAIAEPSLTYRAVMNINRAQNWDEFRDALRDWSVPSQNFVYADVDGNIGYQAPGLIPIRRSGDGLLPVPGWTDDYEWQGYIPFEKLPSSFNPPQGYIVTANNAVVGSDYPYLISLEWDRGYRAQRIVDMIKAKSVVTLEDIKAQQMDNANLPAQEVMPYLAAQSFEEPKLQDGINYLKAWDFQQHMDSGPAALYNLFWVRLIKNTFLDELKDRDDLWPGAGANTMLAVHNLLPQPANHWWDNVTTPDRVESRDDILRQSFMEAYEQAEDLMGNDPTRWAWGELHTATFRNQTFGKSGIGFLEVIFNRGPVPASGGASIVNATAYRLSILDDGSTDPHGFEVVSLPSMRMVVDLSNLSNSQSMHTTGQSGHPFNSHYDDMIDPWRTGQYHLMVWDRPGVEASAKVTLTLNP